MPTRAGERGQATVELVGVLPLVAVLGFALWQSAVAGQAPGMAGAGARAAGRGGGGPGAVDGGRGRAGRGACGGDWRRPRGGRARGAAAAVGARPARAAA